MLFKSRRNEYADTDGPVRYLDDSGLRRPLDMPRPQIAIMFAFVLVAALIGGYLLFNVLDAVRAARLARKPASRRTCRARCPTTCRRSHPTSR